MSDAGTAKPEKAEKPEKASKRREASAGNDVAEGVRGAPEGGRRLFEVVLQQPRFGERRAHGELVFARKDRRSQQRREHVDRLGSAALLEGAAGAGQQRLQRRWRHGRSIALVASG